MLWITELSEFLNKKNSVDCSKQSVSKNSFRCKLYHGFTVRSLYFPRDLSEANMKMSFHSQRWRSRRRKLAQMEEGLQRYHTIMSYPVLTSAISLLKRTNTEKADMALHRKVTDTCKVLQITFVILGLIWVFYKDFMIRKSNNKRLCSLKVKQNRIRM